MGLISWVTWYISSTRVFKRLAENTLDTYQGNVKGRGRYRMEPVCFGCDNEDHVFLRGGTIFCPKGNDPDIKAKADARFKEISDRAKDRADNKLTKTQEYWHKKDPDRSVFTSKSLKKIKNQVFAANIDGSTFSSNSYYRPARSMIYLGYIHRPSTYKFVRANKMYSIM